MKPVQESPKLPQVAPTSFQGVVESFASMSRVLTSVLYEFGYRINRMLPKDGSERMTEPFPLAIYENTGDLPPASEHEGSLVYVRNTPVFQHVQRSDGSSWAPV